MFFVLIEIAFSKRFQLVHSTYWYFIEDHEDISKLSLFSSWPGVTINPQWLKLRMSRTNFHGPKDVRAIEVRLNEPLTVWLSLVKCTQEAILASWTFKLANVFRYSMKAQNCDYNS